MDGVLQVLPISLQVAAKQLKVGALTRDHQLEVVKFVLRRLLHASKHAVNIR